MAKLLGFYDGPRPLAQLLARRAHAEVFGDYESPGAMEHAHSPFEYGLQHLRGLAADAPPKIYDLSQPGRVREIKKALKMLGQAASAPISEGNADPAKEARWATMTVDDDVWSDDAADEYVTFLSRWAPRYLCFAVPLFGMANGQPQPTVNGLLLLDVATRYEGANLFRKGVAIVKACGYGTVSDTRLDLFEAFLTGASPDSSSDIDLDPSKQTNVQIAATPNVESHPIPPPGIDDALYAKWKTSDEVVASLYESMTKAPAEGTRSAILEGIATERKNRDDSARQILAKLPPRQGTTTLTCVNPKEVYDPKLGVCVAAPPPPSPKSMAAWVVGGLAVGALGLVWIRSGRPRRSR